MQKPDMHLSASSVLVVGWVWVRLFGWVRVSGWVWPLGWVRVWVRVPGWAWPPGWAWVPGSARVWVWVWAAAGPLPQPDWQVGPRGWLLRLGRLQPARPGPAVRPAKWHPTFGPGARQLAHRPLARGRWQSEPRCRSGTGRTAASVR